MAKLWRTLAGAAAAFGVPAVLNARVSAATKRLESRLPGERRYYPWDGGYVFYAQKGEGSPVVLVHGVYPGASSQEWTRNLEALATAHRVYALDLLGFGLSDRPRITYDPPLYESLLGDFLQDVVGEPATLCASGLTGAYAIHTAFQRPSRVARLVLVGPAGLYDWAEPPRLRNFLLHRVLRFPVLGLSAYYTIVSRAGLQRYLESRLYHDRDSLPQEMVDGHYTVAHQAGASYAAAALFAGLLDESVGGVFGELAAPVLLVWGRHSRLVPIDNVGGFLSLNPGAELETFERSGALPQVEEAERFNQIVLRWLA